jgi:hypothetical protein
MRNTSVDMIPGIAPGGTLVARGGELRTFGGLALLLVVALFVLGAYLIEDQFTNPLASQSLGLFAAAVLLASAMAMLYELIQLPSSLWRRGALAPKRPQSTLAGIAPPGGQVVCAATPPSPAPVRMVHRTDLAYQRCYVDRVRVRA